LKKLAGGSETTRLVGFALVVLAVPVFALAAWCAIGAVASARPNATQRRHAEKLRGMEERRGMPEASLELARETVRDDEETRGAHVTQLGIAAAVSGLAGVSLLVRGRRLRRRHKPAARQRLE
jgi:hypothetical protein